MSSQLKKNPNEISSCCARSKNSMSRGEVAASATLPISKTDCCTMGQTACGEPAEGMIRLEGGEFLMGTDSAEAWEVDGEGPVRAVRLSPFWIDACAVTNTQFEEFTRATGYVTEAERFGWSYVFQLHLSRKARSHVVGTAGGAEWWLGIEEACWKRPDGPGSTIRQRLNHPVVHISWSDAAAYAKWAQKRLPTEAEWEYGARGGLVQKLYPWGDVLRPLNSEGVPESVCNIWEGDFPESTTKRDGRGGAVPVDAYAPNGYGLSNMSGNVWEWCADWFSSEHPESALVIDPIGPANGTLKVMKGGSQLCHISYCNRYRVAARTANTPDSTTGHCGFRCARSV